MMKKSGFLAFGVLAVLVSLFSLGFATQYSTDLQLTTLTTEQCPYTTVQIIGHLTNTGDTKDTYTITSDSEWIRIAPDTITLEAGQTATTYVYLTPELAAEGKYTLTVKVQSSQSKDSETITLNLMRCYGVNLNAKAPTQTACIGDTASFSADITNMGKYTETFDVVTNGNAKDASHVTLASGQAKTLTIQTPVTKDKQTVTVNAKSQSSYASASLNLNVNGAVCYASTITAVPDTASACIGDATAFSINVKNSGTKSETFNLSANAGTLNANTATVDAGQTKSLALTYTPATAGTTNFVVAAKSAYEKLEAHASLIAAECRGVAVLVVPGKLTAVKGDTAALSITVKNIGRKVDTYSLTSSMGAVSPARMTINGGEAGTAIVTIDTSKLPLGAHNITMKADNGAGFSDKATAQLSLEEGHSATFALQSQQDTNVCPGEQARYSFALANTGKRADTYSITATAGILSDSTVIVEAGKSKNISLTIASTLKDEGTKSAIVTARGINLNQTIKVNAGYKNLETCYGFELSAVPQNASIKGYSPSEYKPALYTITVKNTGSFANNFTFSAAGPNWSYVDPKSIALNAGAEGKTYAYMAPPYKIPAGTYEATITATPLQGMKKQATIKLAFESANNLTDVQQPSQKTENKSQANATAAGNNASANSTASNTTTANKTQTATNTTPAQPNTALSNGTTKTAVTPSINTHETALDRRDFILLTKGDKEIVKAAYKGADGKNTSVTVEFTSTPFSISIGNVGVIKGDVSKGQSTLFLVDGNKKYDIALDMADISAEPEFYKFRIASINVTENAGDVSPPPAASQATSETAGAGTTPRKNSKILIAATVLGLLIVLAIYFWPAVSEAISKGSDSSKSSDSPAKKKKKQPAEKKEEIKEILDNI